MNGRIVSRVYKRLLISCLHGEEAELCLANSFIVMSHPEAVYTLIDTFFSKLRAFLAEQRRRRKANDD